MARKALVGRPGRPWWWLRLSMAVAAPVCALNLAVAFFGSSMVFPLSPFFLREKAVALKRYAVHRVGCLGRGHEPMAPSALQAARRHGLPPGLLESVVEAESGGWPHRISRAGAMGPAQLTDATARHLRVEDPFEPVPALDGAARYLASHLRRFGEVRLAVAAYNAGPGAVRGAVPRNGETEFYVERVMGEYARRSPSPAASLARPPTVDSPPSGAEPRREAPPKADRRAPPGDAPAATSKR